MEPLLRWLQLGARGYQYGCLRQTKAEKFTHSAVSYADGLLTISSSDNNLIEQAHKTGAFTRHGQA